MVFSPTLLPRLLTWLLLGVVTSHAASTSDTRWWPEQKTPERLVIVDSGLFTQLAGKNRTELPVNLSRERYSMLAESLGGLMAQAVNEGRSDELLWIASRGSKAYAEWLDRLVKRTGMETRKSRDLWALIAEQGRRGVVKGYILYRHERVGKDDRENPAVADESANVATTLAGLLGGVVVEEGLQAEADKAGLKMLRDARTLTEAEVFAKHKHELNRHYAMVQTPDRAFGRDLAIAHRMMVIWGRESPTPEVYAWMEPIGTVYGWNLDPEDKAVGQVSEAGHIIVPCDWAPNLPALSCGSPSSLENLEVPRFRTPEPVAAREDQSVVGVVMSDGDNLQWLLTTFTHAGKFWAHPDRNEFPTAWGLPTGDLLQMAPDAYNFLVETQGDKTSLLLHVGYYYPDTFGKLRGPGERIKLLKRLANRVELVLKASGTSLFTFLVMDLDSEDAKEAYRIFAAEIPSLTGMFAIQYSPYEGGEGDVMWFPRNDGGEVPVTTAAYAIWKASEKRVRAKNPERLAEVIAQTAEVRNAEGKPFSDWIISHVWSEFPGPDGEPTQGTDPVLKFERLINSNVPVVTVEQIVRRLQQARKDNHP